MALHLSLLSGRALVCNVLCKWRICVNSAHSVVPEVFYSTSVVFSFFVYVVVLIPLTCLYKCYYPSFSLLHSSLTAVLACDVLLG